MQVKLSYKGRMILLAELQSSDPEGKQEARPMSIQSVGVGLQKTQGSRIPKLLSLPTNSDSDISKNSHCNPHTFSTMRPLVIYFDSHIYPNCVYCFIQNSQGEVNNF